MVEPETGVTRIPVSVRRAGHGSDAQVAESGLRFLDCCCTGLFATAGLGIGLWQQRRKTQRSSWTKPPLANVAPVLLPPFFLAAPPPPPRKQICVCVCVFRGQVQKYATRNRKQEKPVR